MLSPKNRQARVNVPSVANTVEVLSTRRFRRRFLQSLSREMLWIAIVSPFVTAIPGFSSTYDFFRFLLSRRPELTIDLVTTPPQDGQNGVLSLREAKLIEELGVRLSIRSNPTLHSKVYYVQYLQGDSSSFVGSANFTRGGFESNDETVAYWRRSGADVQVKKEIARLTGGGAYTLSQWMVKQRQGR